MARKNKAPRTSNTLVAAANILIEGKPFAAGEAIEGVSRDELAKAVSARRVVKHADYAAKFERVPAPAEDVQDDQQGEPKQEQEAEG